MNSLPRLAALLLAAGTLLRMLITRSWVGDWNETGSIMGVSGILGGTLAGIVLAVHARRNLRPLITMRIGGSWARVLVGVLLVPLAPSAVAWLFTCCVYYGITAAVNPAPSAPSVWPLLAASAGAFATLLIAILAGLVLHVALALPLVLVLGFLTPAVLGSLEPSAAGNFSIATSTSLQMQFAPVTSFYVRQCSFFLALAALSGCAAIAIMRQRGLAGALVIGTLLVTAAALFVALGPQERITDAAITSASRCASRDGVEVCVVSDHARFLDATLDTAVKVRQTLPSDAIPTRYVERGLAVTPADAVLEPSGLAIDPLSQTVDATAAWRLCTSDAPIERSVWIAHRAGFLPNLPTLDQLAEVRGSSDADQIAWWKQPMRKTC